MTLPLVKYPFPLRPPEGFVYVMVPRDITHEEIDRLVAMMRTLVADGPASEVK